jgi:hypothetical protein
VLDDLLWHELEVVKVFFARALAWATTEAAAEGVALANASEETIEAVVLHAHGPHNFEQIVIRAVIHELNALCEFALQNTWRSVSKGEDLSDGEYVFTASRGAIEKALASRDVDVETWPRWSEVLKIKELSEGFKHRQRLQPLPKNFRSAGSNGVQHGSSNRTTKSGLPRMSSNPLTQRISSVQSRNC